MASFAEILPDPGRALGQLFTYRIPDFMEGTLAPGAQVLVPFGPRTVVGLVVALTDQTDRVDLKEVEAVLEGDAPLPEEAFPLARWIAHRYLCDLGEAIRPFLLGGTRYRISRKFALAPPHAPETPSQQPRNADERLLLRHLAEAGGEVSLSALRRILPGDDLSRALRQLKARQTIVERAVVQYPSARARRLRLVEAALTPPEIEEYCLNQQARAPARAACLRLSAATGPLPPAELAARAGVSPSVVQAMVKASILRPIWRQVRRIPWEQETSAPTPPPILNAEQTAAVHHISQAADAGRYQSFLLYGITASGKTEVFMRVAQQVIDRGLQVIVLMPEISLTAIALGLYRSRFGDQVAVVHSALSPGERWDEWQRIRRREASLVIGARSALFAPTPRLGLIVVDEEHETSYKQEQAPRYHAREAALERGRLVNCPVVLASATPALETFYRAETGEHQLLRLSTRVESRPLPAIKVVDMRGRSSRPAIFSLPLRQGIAARLRAREQVILFLNRRGYAAFLFCPLCGESLRCRDCGVSLTLHRQAHQVRCHHCGMSRPPPTTCARCGGFEIRFSGFGTERVERELGRIFPQARPGRLDSDTASLRGSHVEIVGRFRSAETDVLVGTQMVAKGFDFPEVTLVGVISADTSLNVPDFRAAERTFQLVTQVAGRSGRGDKAGEVVVQTYQPDHYSIVAAARQDYEAFYREEIAARRELGYPPFSQLVNITVSSPDADAAAERAQEIARDLAQRFSGKEARVTGPAPAPIAKLRGRHRWQVLVRALPGEAQPVLRQMIRDLHARPALRVSLDVDPVSFM